MEKAFLLSYFYRDNLYYKLVYAETEETAISKLQDYLDELYLNLFGWKNKQHYIKSETI